MQRALTLFLLCASTPALACGNPMMEGQTSTLDWMVPLALAGAAVSLVVLAVVLVAVMGMFMLARRA